MITDAQMDAFLDHDARCNCANCGLVVEYLSGTARGLSLLNLLESKGLSELNRIIGMRHRR